MIPGLFEPDRLFWTQALTGIFDHITTGGNVVESKNTETVNAGAADLQAKSRGFVADFFGNRVFRSHLVNLWTSENVPVDGNIFSSFARRMLSPFKEFSS